LQSISASIKGSLPENAASWQALSFDRGEAAPSYQFVIALWRAREPESGAVKSMIALPVRRWTIVGLLVALFSMPLVSALFTVLQIPLTAQNVLFQQAILFTWASFQMPLIA
jgi:hypothetical protein